jgi:hypothetical protein
VFHLDATLLGSTSLMGGDALTDSNGVTYAVLFVEHQTLENTVAVVCRPPSS